MRANKNISALCYLIAIAARANLLRLQSFANENENPSKVCQTFRLLKLQVRQAFQTYQASCFRNLVVNQTQIPSLASLPFSWHQSNSPSTPQPSKRVNFFDPSGTIFQRVATLKMCRSVILYISYLTVTVSCCSFV